MRDEAGCLRFDLMEDAQRPTHYFYEIYQIHTFSDVVVSHSDELPA